MKSLLPKTPRHLLTLSALFVRRQTARVEPALVEDTRMPDDIELMALQHMASTQMGRIAAEVALEEGSRRQYAARNESVVLERR